LASAVSYGEPTQRSSGARLAGWIQVDSVARFLLLSVLYSVSAWAVLELGKTPAGADVIWPANGILLAFLLRAPRRYWASYLVTSVLVNIPVHLLIPYPIVPTLLFSGANTVETLLAAHLLANAPGCEPNLQRLRTAMRFMALGVMLAPMVAWAVLVSEFHLFRQPIDLLSSLTFLTGDMLGLAIMTPLMLAIDKKRLQLLFAPNKRLEAAAILAGTSVFSVAVFAQNGLPITFLLIPILLLAIFRLGISGGAISVFLIAVPGAYFTAHGGGPFALMRSGLPIHQVFLFQLFLFVAVIVLYSVSSVLHERERLQVQLAEALREAEASAGRDHLTGLANRRGFDVLLEKEWRRAIREKGSLSLLMIDVDHFKAYNDTYGHIAGDECLRRVAEILLQARLRTTDLAVRFGGDEFAIVLIRSTKQGAEALAERLRHSIEEAAIPHQPNPIGIVTVTIGVSTLVPNFDMEVGALMQQADMALYEAKQAGRNRSVARTGCQVGTGRGMMGA
jgi:diguanylate cyclase (GGDEF)-like protein